MEDDSQDNGNCQLLPNIMPKSILSKENGLVKEDTAVDSKNTAYKTKLKKFLNKRKRQRKKQKRKMMSEDSSTVEEESKEVPMYPLSNDPLSIAERHRMKREKRSTRSAEDDLKAQKAFEYLSKWETDRSNWKFNKSLDIFITKYCLNAERIPKSQFKTILDYISSGKGSSLSRVRSVAQNILDNETQSEDKEAKSRLKRAKKIVKHFRDKC